MKNPLAYLLGKMWDLSEKNRSHVVLYAILFFGANIAISLEPLAVGLFLNAVQTEGVNRANFAQLIVLISAIFVLEAFFWSMHGPARVLENFNAFRVRANYKNRLLGGTFGLPIEWHTDHHSGDTIDKIEKGTNAVFIFSGKTFELEQSVIMLAVSLGALLFFSVPAALAALILSAVTFYILTRFDRRLIPGYEAVNRAENRIAAKVYDALSNISTIIVLRVQRLVLGSLEKEIEKPYKQYCTNIVLNEWKWFAASMMGRLTVVTAIGIYLALNLDAGTVLAGTVYILFNYSNRIREVFYQFAYSYHDIVNQRASVANAEELPLEPATGGRHAQMQLPANWKSIEVENLSFCHQNPDGKTSFGLRHLKMTIKKGEHIALIGPSGAGKSTLLKVIRDLHHPAELKLSVDGAASGRGFAAISDSISLIPQEPEIFASTIRENITLGVDYPKAEINKFADMAVFSEVIWRLPKGLESLVVEKGVNLSGGEKQRLALARGLLASSDKELVLLDEPTSSVDFHNELLIYENIFESFGEKTIISAVHRLYLLPIFDKIYYIKEGAIVASGSFEELKASSPDFNELWSKYASKKTGWKKVKDKLSANL